MEIGSGSGGTSVVVMAAMAPFADHVDFLYTDISPALVGYGRKTYSGLYPFARFHLLDVEKDVQGEGVGSYDVVFGTNVLHATRNMTNTLQNCKALLRRGDNPNAVSMLCISVGCVCGSLATIQGRVCP